MNLVALGEPRRHAAGLASQRLPRAMAPAATLACPARGTIVQVQFGALADGPLAKCVVGSRQQIERRPPTARRSASTAGERPWRRAHFASASTRSTSACNDRVLVHSRHPIEARRPLREEAVDAFLRTPGRRQCGSSVSSSRSRCTSSRSMPAAWLISPLATANAAGGPAATVPATAPHVFIERSSWMHRVDQAEFQRAAGIEPRIQQHQLHRAPKSDEARQHERRALGAGQPGLRIRPLEDRAIGCETRSQHIARPNPPAAAMPSTAAMNGFGARRISAIVLCRYSRICLKRSPHPGGVVARVGLR